MSQSIFECSSETTIPNAGSPADPSTFFLMVKGTADGQILSVRAKFVFTETIQQAPLAVRAARMLVLIGQHTHWLDLAEEAEKVAALTPFTFDAFGVTVRFSAEFSGPGRYNLIIAPTAKLESAQRRSQDFFDRENYWPLLPEHGGPPITSAQDEVEVKPAEAPPG